MKLWKGRFEETADPVFEKMNRSLGVDAVLLDVDIRASRAHARALLGCGVLTEAEWQEIDRGLEEILTEYTPEQVRALPFEDVHTFVEATLTQRIGPAGQKLHTGRSRNDQVATDFRMYVKKAIALVIADIEAVEHALLVDPRKSTRSILIPAYTHLRRAQPIRWSHYCLAFVEMFGRDKERFEQSAGRVDVLPLGSGAVAGSNFQLDREAVARELGFARISANSLDATCDRDFVVEFLSNCALMMTHASRLAEDWIIYSTEEFGFLELSEKVTTGSSLMPQKKNPDGLELIRAKAAIIAGSLTGFLSLMKGLPTGYNKDLQEDKVALISAFDNVRLSLSVLRFTVRTVRVEMRSDGKGRRRLVYGGYRPGRLSGYEGRAVSRIPRNCCNCRSRGHRTGTAVGCDRSDRILAFLCGSATGLSDTGEYRRAKVVGRWDRIPDGLVTADTEFLQVKNHCDLIAVSKLWTCDAVFPDFQWQVLVFNLAESHSLEESRYQRQAQTLVKDSFLRASSSKAWTIARPAPGAWSGVVARPPISPLFELYGCRPPHPITMPLTSATQ